MVVRTIATDKYGNRFDKTHRDFEAADVSVRGFEFRGVRVDAEVDSAAEVTLLIKYLETLRDVFARG